MNKPKEINKYIKEVKKTTGIVEDSIEKGNYSLAIEKLEVTLNDNENKNKYVFYQEEEKKFKNILTFSAIGVLSIIYFYYFYMCMGTLIYSNEYKGYPAVGITIILILLALNMMFVRKMIQQSGFNARYNQYYTDLRFKNIEIIDDLVSYTKISDEKIVTDLQKAVKDKLIPQGHFGTDNIIFMTSDEIYERYKNKQAVYDQYYRKQAEERLRMKERSKEMQEILDQGQKYIDKIHTSNDIIKDKIISEKLDEMEKIVSMIFHEVDINPDQADNLGMFMNYYLPTTDKLLTSYIEIDGKQIQGQTIKKTKKEIEEVLDKIIESFEKLLDKFYQEKQLDISTDISAMEIMMKQEGLIK